MGIFIQPIASLAKGGADTSDAARRRFLGPPEPARPDARAPLQPLLADAREPGLAERWTAFDEIYRARARFRTFWAAELEDAVVHPPFGIVTVGDAIVRETVTDVDRLCRTFPGLDGDRAKAQLAGDPDALGRPLVPIPPAASERSGPAFLLGWGLADNYYNWTVRYLSKVAQWQRGAADQSLLVPAFTKGFIAGSLDALDVPQASARPLAAPVRVDRLTLTAPSLFTRHSMSPRLVPGLRHHPAVERRWRGEARPLYLLRRRGGIRRVVNEQAVVAALGPRGFVAFDPGAHAIEAQIRAFRDTSLVVAPHGAALANIVYCPPGTPVVEIVPEGYDQGVTSYRSLADLFGLPYRQMMAPEQASGVRANRCNSDIAVSIDHLLALLDTLPPRA